MKPLFKLETEIKELPNCPPIDCESYCITAIRFVHNPLTNGSFKTYSELGNDISRNPCNGHALSFFDSVENARAYFNKLKNNAPNIGQKIGDHIAKGVIDKNDGEVTKVSLRGHFSFFEYKDRNLLSKFKIVDKL